MGPEAGTLSPGISAGLNTAAPPLSSAGAPGADALMAGGNATTTFEPTMLSSTTTPESAGGGLWETIKGYSDNPYVQQLFQTAKDKLTQKKQPPEPMQFASIASPVVPTGSDALDKLAWLRAFNVQG
jgi:hypothetical protein